MDLEDDCTVYDLKSTVAHVKDYNSPGNLVAMINVEKSYHKTDSVCNDNNSNNSSNKNHNNKNHNNNNKNKNNISNNNSNIKTTLATAKTF